MGQEKQNAQKAKDLLTLCLAKAIQESLSARLGENWFQAFLQEDHAQDPKFQIARNGQASVRDFDLQALLKILRYRDRFAEQVFAYYHFADAFTDQTKKRQIRSLLDRLITDFRNSIEAHSCVADIEQEPDRIYGYQEALRDMQKLSGFFKTVTDQRGVSYHSQISKLCKLKDSYWWILFAAIPVLIAIVISIIGFNSTGNRGNPATEPVREPPTSGNVFYNPNNISIMPNEVTVRPRHVYYEGDQLVADCFVLNGYGTTVSRIRVDKLVIIDSTNNITVAQAAFGELDGLQIAPNAYGEWTFRFPKDTVLNWDGELSALNLQFHCTYNH